MPETDYLAELGALALASRLRRLLQRLHSEGEQVYRDLGLDFKPKWFPVLHLLSKRSSITLTEMAQLLSIAHPSLIETVRELSAAGLVRSRTSYQDARRRDLSLTRDGKRLCAELQLVWNAFGAAGEEAIREGRNDFLGALNRLEHSLQRKSMHERIMARVESKLARGASRRRSRKPRNTGVQMHYLTTIHGWRGLLLATVCSLLLGATGIAYAQSDSSSTLKRSDIAEVIDSVLAAFELHYVYPDTAQALSTHVRQRQADGAYDKFEDLAALTRQLRDDIRAFTHDGHVYISVMSPGDTPPVGDTLTDLQVAQRARSNFGFRKAEWLVGNVGYLRIDRLEDAVFAGAAAAAAMNFIAHSEAVILDLRYNGGGYETMVRFLASYFFRDPTLINALYFTETDSLEQSWTSAYVPGRKLIAADLYILISGRTASGAEALSYGLKHSGRATLIGESTAGVAHWTESWDFPNLQVRADIPIARPINPVTKTSWERTGVKPHIEVPPDEALWAAHREALKSIMARTSDEQRSKELAWDLIAVKAQTEAVTLTQGEMQACTGEYADGRYGILIKNGALYWRYVDATEYILLPLAADLFGFDDSDDFRVQMVRDVKDVVTGFRLLSRSGGPGPIRPRTGNIK